MYGSLGLELEYGPLF